MNDEHVEQILASLKEVHAPKHRTALRAALMREHARVRRPYFALQSFTQYMTMKTALIPVSTFAVLALVTIGTLGVTHKSAEAQELVERSMARAIQIPAEMRAKIEEQMKADMMETLKEAYAAPDLRILTREEYEKEAQFTMATGTPRTATIAAVRKIHNAEADFAVAGEVGTFTVSSAPISWESSGAVSGEAHGTEDVIAFSHASGAVSVSAEPTHFGFTKVEGEDVKKVKFTSGTFVGGFDIKQPVKYLRYTDSDGRKVTLGLDEEDVPVFRIEELTAKDVVRGPDGVINIQGKVLHQIKVQMQNFDGGFGEAGAVQIINAQD
jgi:hypothetical protein